MRNVNTASGNMSNGPIRVINKRRASKAEREAATYVGRGRGSVLGNPYKPGEQCARCGEIHERGETLGCYEAYLHEKIEAEDEAICGALNRLYEEARAAMESGGDVLVMCWCKPAPCHGDVIKRIVEEQLPPSPATDEGGAKDARESESGYSLMGGYSTHGRGTPGGAEKDQAMRRVASGAIVELDRGRTRPSSTRTTIKELGAPALEEAGEIVMLARNGSLSGRALRDATGRKISEAHDAGARFVVGDMPGADEALIRFLDRIGARFCVYHAGEAPRIDLTNLQEAI